MSSAEPQQQQQSWPDLDVSYFRWEPPVFPSIRPPGAPEDASAAQTSGGQPAAQQQQQRQHGRRMESAFAHSDFPATFAGWDKLRAASEAGQLGVEPLAGRASGEQSSSAQTNLQWARSAGFGSTASAPLQEPFPELQGTVPGYPAAAGFQMPHSRPPRAAQEPSAFTSLRGERPGNLPVSAGGRAFSLDPPGSFARSQPASFALPGGSPPASGGPAPMLLQCGSFTAPVQQDAARGQAPPSWVPQPSRLGARDARKPPTLPPFLSDDPLQLQEYYTAQSDILEELMRGRGGQREPGYPSSAGASGGEGDGEIDFLDTLGPLLLRGGGPGARGGSNGPEPYMPQWQSESVPAELPNHVVNRLMMGGAPVPSRGRHPSLSGTKRDWLGLPAGGGLKRAESARPGGAPLDPPGSPNVEELEELAKNADLGVAHRAFLVPPHKKRGKGGRQPAADPRLDPNIDARKAKRILANRLSAARSKLRQKSQMDNLGGMVKSLEEHRKLLGDDAAELMEVCEETEFGNRRLLRQVEVLQEFVRRLERQHGKLQQKRASLLEDERPQPSSTQGGREGEPRRNEGVGGPGTREAALPALGSSEPEHPGSVLLSRMAAELDHVDALFGMPH